jgi:hypothetical protein
VVVVLGDQEQLAALADDHGALAEFGGSDGHGVGRIARSRAGVRRGA